MIQRTNNTIKKHKIRLTKSLGQNFLIDENIINKIVDLGDVTKDDLVIEIGPGIGNMTRELAKRAGEVIAVEIDKHLIPALTDNLQEFGNVKIINDDILKVDIDSLIEGSSFSSVKVVANLPYYITTPIIMKLVENDLNIQSITVMIQKEVADRLIAIPGTKETGAITYTIYYYCEGQKIREVQNTCFIPEPEVTSEVINLRLRESPPVQVKDKKVMFKIIKSAYMQRRKTVLNSLTSVGVFRNKTEGTEFLKKIGLREDIRPENMKIEDFAKLTDLFLKNIKNV